MNAHSKNSAQATISLYSMRGKSWSYYQKHIANLIDFDCDSTNQPCRATADVQRLDLTDSNLYGVSPSDPGPMVLCNQCNHIMAPEGIMRHVKRMHGSKIVPAPSTKIRIPTKGKVAIALPTSGIQTISNRLTNNSLSTSPVTDSTLSTEFSSRLNVSKMAPPTPINSSADIANAVNNSSSSNSNSPISLSKISTSTSGSGSGSTNRRNRKILPVKDREYDPEKHCGVRIGNMKPCTRSLTCKTHQISLRRNVEGRSKPFDQLLADHRNNAKETHKLLTSKQITYAAGDSGNQILDSIGDSNSSSSFDMERRSFSSNSNQSTLGNYNSDHSTAFSTSSSQQLNGTQLIPSALSSIASATSSGVTTSISIASGAGTPNFIYTDTLQHRKIGNALPFTPSPDDRSNNASIDLYSSSTLSAMQSSATSLQNNYLHASGLNTSSSLTSLVGDYSIQMNDLINDDNGDGVDMSFWENFDNFNYDTDLLNNSNSSQSYSQLQSKSNSKRAHDGSGSERKRKRIMNDNKDNLNHSKSSKDSTKSGISASPLSHDVGHSLSKTNSNLSQNKRPSPINFGTNILIGAPRNDIICIDDDEDDATNNNTVLRNSDATINRNSDKENGTKYPVTPTKELNNDISTKHHAIRSRTDTERLNGTQSPSAVEKQLTPMTLSEDAVVNSTDLVNVTKILSEADHRNATILSNTSRIAVSTPSTQQTPTPMPMPTPTPTPLSVSQSNITSDIDDNSKHQENQNSISPVPFGENENFLLDMVYKCLRGKGVRVVGPNNSNTINRTISNEKENSIENHWSDDDVPTVPVTAVNNPLLPSSQRFSSLKCANMPRAIASNHFNMARGRGTCHVKHSVDCTKKIQQQIFHRIQTQQHNGTFANNMIALRNNGSIMRLNSANLIGCPSLGTITNSINTTANSVNVVKTTVAAATVASVVTTNATPATIANNVAPVVASSVSVANNTMANTSSSSVVTATITSPTTAAKVAFKKPVHFVNSIATTTNGPIVLLNPSGTTMTTVAGNPRYAIFRRPINQSIQLIARPTIDPSNSYSVMPVIHRVRTRTLKPNVPKRLESDRLMESLKSIVRPQVISVFQSMVKAVNQPNHHLNTNSSSSSSKRKSSHSSSSLSNHKNSNNNYTSSQSMTVSSSQKQNGHHSSNGSITSASNYINSNNTTNDKRTHLRIANDANHK